MQSAVVRAPFLFVVAAGVVLEAVLLSLAWPLGVLLGIAGGALFAAVLGLRLQREADAAPVWDLFGAEVPEPVETVPSAIAA